MFNCDWILEKDKSTSLMSLVKVAHGWRLADVHAIQFPLASTEHRTREKLI